MTLLHDIQALTLHLFGQVLDLGGSLTPFIADWLRDKNDRIDPENFWNAWRDRQRIEQYQDNIVAMGHSGYLPVARRAAVYVSRKFGLDPSASQIYALMKAWQQ